MKETGTQRETLTPPTLSNRLHLLGAPGTNQVTAATDMRRLSTLASRAALVITSKPHHQSKPIKTNPLISKAPSLRGTLFPNSDSPLLTSTKVSLRKQKQRVLPNPIDHHYITQILSSKDWHLLLNHELKAGRVNVKLQSIVSILQKQENPVNCVRFYIWVSNINPWFEKNQRVRGVLGDTLQRKGPVLLSAELVQEITRSGFQVSEDLLCVLIGSWGKLGLAKYCTEVFRQISYLGLSPSTRLYNTLLDALIKSNSLDLAYLKFQQMPADYCKPDRFTYNILIHGVCKAGVVDEALRLVKQMEALGYEPNVFTYTILVDGFCNANRVDDALQLLETMRARKVNPSEATFRSLVHGVFRCREPSEAFELLSRFVEHEPILPNVACDTILYCLSSNFMAKEAAAFLRKIKGRGYLPDHSVFNITMTCLIKKLTVEETCEVLDGFLKQGLKLALNSYLALVETLFRQGNIGEGHRYLSQMFQAGLVSNVFSYNMVLDCLFKAKMKDIALEMFRGMQHKGISPNLATFNTLIDGHCKASEIGRARELLVMLLEHGFKPDIYTFTSLISGLCRSRKIEDAFNCFTEMKEWGVTPNNVTYNILISALCVIGHISRSMVVFRKMQADGIIPDSNSFNPLIQCLCKMNKVEKAQKLFVSMLSSGLTPNNITYGAIIKLLCELGRVDEATKMFLSMDGCIPDSDTCTSLVDVLVERGNFKAVDDVLKKCKEWKITLDDNNL